jgi:uncharacterized membrane protein YkoI
MPAAQRSAAMAGYCPNAANRELLIYVSFLSGSFRHGALVKNRANTMKLDLAAAVLVIAAILAAVSSPLCADERDDMRDAVERGDIRSLADILAALRGKLPGEVAGVEIERKNGRWLYEFRVIDDKGRLFEVYVDAGTATIERTKEK